MTFQPSILTRARRYLFGGIEFVKKRFEVVIIAIVIISVLPMVVEFILHKRRARQQTRQGFEVTVTDGSEPAPEDAAV